MLVAELPETDWLRNQQDSLIVSCCELGKWSSLCTLTKLRLPVPPVLFTTTRSRLRTAVGVCKRIITRSTVLIVPYAAQKA